MAEQRLAVVPQQLQNLDDAYQRHDPQAMAALSAPGCRVTIPGVDIRGRDQVEGLWRSWFHAFPDAATQILRAPCEKGPGHHRGPGRDEDDRGGEGQGRRLEFQAELGPPHEHQQYTAPQRALEAAEGPAYWRTATVTFAPGAGNAARA